MSAGISQDAQIASFKTPLGGDTLVVTRIYIVERLSEQTNIDLVSSSRRDPVSATSRAACRSGSVNGTLAQGGRKSISPRDVYGLVPYTSF